MFDPMLAAVAAERDARRSRGYRNARRFTKERPFLTLESAPLSFSRRRMAGPERGWRRLPSASAREYTTVAR
jgi:hypothetical protein